MNNVINQVAYLRTSREFPENSKDLAFQVNKSYVDIASAVNNRTIGLFSTSAPSITGESWFLSSNRRQQSLRQVYTFTSTADINIGFKIATISQFSRLFGVYKDSSSNWYGLIAGTSVAIAGQISFYLVVNNANPTSDILRFATGAGAPALSSGTVVLEWLSNV